MEESPGIDVESGGTVEQPDTGNTGNEGVDVGPIRNGRRHWMFSGDRPVSSAGILPVAVLNGEIKFLVGLEKLGKPHRLRFNFLGGKVDRLDVSELETALREFNEETGSLLSPHCFSRLRCDLGMGQECGNVTPMYGGRGTKYLLFFYSVPAYCLSSWTNLPQRHAQCFKGITGKELLKRGGPADMSSHRLRWVSIDEVLRSRGAFLVGLFVQKKYTLFCSSVNRCLSKGNDMVGETLVDDVALPDLEALSVSSCSDGDRTMLCRLHSATPISRGSCESVRGWWDAIGSDEVHFTLCGRVREGLCEERRRRFELRKEMQRRRFKEATDSESS